MSPAIWRYASATRAHVVVDAADYFDLMQDAMLAARQRIMLIGWEFDTRIHLGEGRRWWNLPRKGVFPARLGAFIVWLAKRRRDLQVRVLKWNFGALKFIFRGTMIIDLLRWSFQRGIRFSFDSAHPIGCSHHQKLVVIDDSFAACGGIDMTSDRWDTPQHIELDPRRRLIGGRLYAPWHDLTMLVEGDAARALGDLGRDRWARSGRAPMAPCQPQDGTAWPQRLDAQFADVELGISRTRARYDGAPEIREVEELYVEHIARARRFIYAESQYFASRRVAEAMAQRLSEADPPEILLICPLESTGWLQQTAMDGARVELCHALAERDHKRRFRIFIPYASAGTPIYVHAKLMIVDDMILRIGSSNMNNRSMGLDSECDVSLDAARPGNAHIIPTIMQLRHSLLAEHCGLDVARIGQLLEQHGSMTEMIDALCATPGGMPGKYLAPFSLRPLTDAEKAVADNALLDPERPEDMFEPISHRRGLFRRGGILRRPV